MPKITQEECQCCGVAFEWDEIRTRDGKYLCEHCRQMMEPLAKFTEDFTLTDAEREVLEWGTSTKER